MPTRRMSPVYSAIFAGYCLRLIWSMAVLEVLLNLSSMTRAGLLTLRRGIITRSAYPLPVAYSRWMTYSFLAHIYATVSTQAKEFSSLYERMLVLSSWASSMALATAFSLPATVASRRLREAVIAPASLVQDVSSTAFKSSSVTSLLGT